MPNIRFMPWLTFTLLIAALPGCSSPTPDEAALITTFEKMVASIEAGNVSEAGESLHDDFQLNRSGSELTEQQTRLLLAHTLKRYQNVKVVTSNVNTRIDPVKLTEATIEFNALVTAGTGWIPEDGNLYRVQTRWLFDDGEWLLASASSKRALEQ